MDVNELHLHAVALDNGDYSNARAVRDALRAAAEEIEALRRERDVLRAAIEESIDTRQRFYVQWPQRVLAEADKAREGK